MNFGDVEAEQPGVPVHGGLTDDWVSMGEPKEARAERAENRLHTIKAILVATL